MSDQHFQRQLWLHFPSKDRHNIRSSWSILCDTQHKVLVREKNIPSHPIILPIKCIGANLSLKKNRFILIAWTTMEYIRCRLLPFCKGSKYVMVIIILNYFQCLYVPTMYTMYIYSSWTSAKSEFPPWRCIATLHGYFFCGSYWPHMCLQLVKCEMYTLWGWNLASEEYFHLFAFHMSHLADCLCLLLPLLVSLFSEKCN